MNRRIGSLPLLVAASFAVPTYAQQPDVQAFVDLATKGADTANRCSNLIGGFLALKVPADHATARARVAANAKAPTARPLPISPENVNYLQQVDSFKIVLSSCGRQFATLRGQIQPNERRFYGLIDKNAMPRADAQKVATAMTAYNDAHQKLVKAVLALSADKQVESHLDQVIVADFIAPAQQITR